MKKGDSKKGFNKRTVLWVNSTYFAEGLPYMVVRFLSSVFFTDIGVREAYLGFLNFLAIPWNLKFLWAPLVDIMGSKKGWLLKIQLSIGLLTALMAVLTLPLSGEFTRGIIPAGGPNMVNILITLIFILLAFLSATHDIAIDAYYMEALPTEKEQSLYSGLRVLAYRGAVIYARSVLLLLAAATNWFYGFGLGAITILGLFIFHSLFLKDTEKPSLYEPSEGSGRTDRFKEGLQIYRNAFFSYLSQQRIVTVILFIILYKLGDEILFSMNTPFLLRELGMTKAQLGWVSGILGTISAIIGSLWGGKWISSWGLRRAIWPITIIMNITILAYVYLAWITPSAQTLKGIAIIAVINSYEQFASGLGTAALMVFLMGRCSPDYRAAHYAIGSAIMSLGGTLFGGFGGIVVELFGYINLYILAFIASIPSLLLLFRVPLEYRSQENVH
jgi:PAT family beta-lactamase induction signal transducer AmpG